MNLRLIAACTGLGIGLPFAQPLGSPDLESGLSGRDDLVFFDDFESPSWYKNWLQPSQPANASRVSEPAFRGTSSLRVFVGAGEHNGVSMGFDFADQGPEELEEIWFRYYVYFAASWHRNGREVGKLPGISGTYNTAGWGGRPAHGGDGWTARMMNSDAGGLVKLGFYCHHADMTGTYGDHLERERDSLGWVERERWHTVEVHARMNTITAGAGNNDGILQGWVNGRPAYERADLRSRETWTT